MEAVNTRLIPGLAPPGGDSMEARGGEGKQKYAASEDAEKKRAPGPSGPCAQYGAERSSATSFRREPSQRA